MVAKKTVRTLIAATCLLLFTAAVADDMSIKVLPLQHHTAASLLPLIKPLLPKGSSITGQGYKLIVKTTAQGLQDTRELIKGLDKPLHMLSISVRRGKEQALQSDTSVLNNVNVYQTFADDELKNQQSVTVLEGKAALINTSQDVPVLTQFSTRNFGQSSNIDYKKLKTGFIVSAHFLGKNKVRIQVESRANHLNRLGQTRFNSDKASTVVIIPLNKWVPIGGITTYSRRLQDARIYQTGDRRVDNSTFYIKVDKFNAKK